MTLDGKSISPITNGPGTAMNVEPAVSPDGNLIAFSSDRSGKPMIYTMSIAGTNVQRKTFAGHYNATPSWSPDGKKIAFAGFDKDKNNFDIFVMNLDSSGLLRLTAAKKRRRRGLSSVIVSFTELNPLTKPPRRQARQEKRED